MWAWVKADTQLFFFSSSPNVLRGRGRRKSSGLEETEDECRQVPDVAVMEGNASAPPAVRGVPSTGSNRGPEGRRWTRSPNRLRPGEGGGEGGAAAELR